MERVFIDTELSQACFFREISLKKGSIERVFIDTELSQVCFFREISLKKTCESSVSMTTLQLSVLEITLLNSKIVKVQRR